MEIVLSFMPVTSRPGQFADQAGAYSSATCDSTWNLGKYTLCSYGDTFSKN